MLINASGWLLLGVRARGVLHVGAHDGEEAAFYHGQGWGPVIWVEMLPEKAAQLRQRFPDPRTDLVIEAACWDVDGQSIALHRASNAQSSSLLAPREHLVQHPDVGFADDGELTTHRLDSVLPESPTFDLVCIDVQGAELQVLNGLGKRLEAVSWACIEVSTLPLYAGAALLPEIDAFMHQHGFVRIARKMAEDHGWGDALYRQAARLSRWERLALWLRSRLWHGAMRIRLPSKVPAWDNWALPL